MSFFFKIPKHCAWLDILRLGDSVGDMINPLRYICLNHSKERDVRQEKRLNLSIP